MKQIVNNNENLTTMSSILLPRESTRVIPRSQHLSLPGGSVMKQ